MVMMMVVVAKEEVREMDQFQTPMEPSREPVQRRPNTNIIEVMASECLANLIADTFNPVSASMVRMSGTWPETRREVRPIPMQVRRG